MKKTCASYSLLIALIAACFAVSAAPLNIATAASPSPQNPGFGLAPCTSNPNDPATRSFLGADDTLILSPGQTYSNCTVVTNYQNNPLTLYVNPVDGLTSTETGAVYSNKGDPLTKAGAWVTATSSSMTIAAYHQQEENFTITVPQTVSPGSHLAGLAFQLTNPQTQGHALQVTTVIREVMGILVTIPGSAHFQVKINSAKIVAQPPTNTAAIIINFGDMGLHLGKPRLNVTLTGAKGYTKTVKHDGSCPNNGCPFLDTMLPGDYINFPLPWPDTLNPGCYTITVTGSGSDGSYPTTYTTSYCITTAIAGSQPNASIAPPQYSLFSNPLFWIIIGLILLIIILIALLFFFIIAPKRRKDKEKEQERKKKKAAKKKSASPDNKN